MLRAGATCRAAAVAVALWSSAAAAAAPSAKFVFPAGGQRGATVEAIVEGVELQDASSVWVSPSDIVGKVSKVVSPTSVAITLQIAPDASLGEHDLRVVTPRGATNRYRFFVGQLPEVVEKQNGADRAQAIQLASLPVTVNGQIQESNRDYFRFSGTAGEVLVFRIQARAILPFIPDAVPGWLDACLTVFDKDGREVASVDDSRLEPDPVLVLTVPASVEYLLEVKDILDRGRGYFVYRLSIGRLPHIWRIEPMGGRIGVGARASLYGVNLPSATLDIPPPSDAARRLVRVDANGIASNSVPFAVGALDEAAEQEPNDTRAAAMGIKAPCTVNGRIDKPGDVDFYRVQARPGEVLLFEVEARRLGSMLDSVLTVYDAQGAKLAENDDAVDPEEPLLTRHADARVVVGAPAGGEVLVAVRDVQDKGGEDFGYRLTVGPPRPGFTVRSSPDNPAVAKGDSAVIALTATRIDGFAGDIVVSAESLPPGFSASGAVIPAGQANAYLTVTVSSDSAVPVCGLRLTAAGAVGGATLTKQVTPSETVMQAFSYTMYPTARETVIGVTAGAGFALSHAAPAEVEVPQGGSAQVTVRAQRAPGAAGEVALASTAPLIEVSAAAPPIGSDKAEAPVTITAARSAPIGLRQNVVITGTMRSGADTFTRTAPAIRVRVIAPKP